MSAVLLSPLALAAVPSLHPSASSALALLVLGLVGTAFGWFLYYSLIAAEGPAFASVSQFLAPGFAILFEAVFRQHSVTTAQVAGFVAIVTGGWLATRRGAGQQDVRTQAASSTPRTR